MIVGLIIILLLVLFLPFTKFVEKNLEAFLFIMGVASVFVSQSWNWDLVKEALTDPINITLAVLAAGLLFRWFQSPIEKSILGVSRAMPFRLFIALFVIILGLLSSVITAIVSAVVLVSVISVLPIERKSQIRMVILACFAIGLGAVLTPIGEPLSTITVSKLDEDFFYLLKLVGTSVVPGVIIFGILSALFVKSDKKPKDKKAAEGELAAGKESDDGGENVDEKESQADTDDGDEEGEAQAESEEEQDPDVESYPEIIIRSLKIYLFVMALTFLGEGFKPFIEAYLLDLSPLIMYWINMVSAVLDNATLASAEISNQMGDETVRDILMGLMISGGMLIPGNIPNIIAAGKLKITSLEYAKFAFPIGLIAMALYFIVILIMH